MCLEPQCFEYSRRLDALVIEVKLDDRSAANVICGNVIGVSSDQEPGQSPMTVLGLQNLVMAFGEMEGIAGVGTQPARTQDYVINR